MDHFECANHSPKANFRYVVYLVSTSDCESDRLGSTPNYLTNFKCVGSYQRRAAGS